MVGIVVRGKYFEVIHIMSLFNEKIFFRKGGGHQDQRVAFYISTSETGFSGLYAGKG